MVKVCRSWDSWDFKLWLQLSWKILSPSIWAMRRWPWISYLLAVFSMTFFLGGLHGCSSNDKPSKESTCSLTIGGVGLAYKKDCSSSKLIQTDLPYPVRWKILQDENLGDFCGCSNFLSVFPVSFPSGDGISFCLMMDLKKICLYSIPKEACEAIVFVVEILHHWRVHKTMYINYFANCLSTGAGFQPSTMRNMCDGRPCQERFHANEPQYYKTWPFGGLPNF